MQKYNLLIAENHAQSTENIKLISPETKIIILTSHNSEEEVLDSIKAGASAFCSKDINPKRLADVALSALKEAIRFDSKISQILPETIKKDADNTKFPNNFDYNLTLREKQVLKLIREGYNNNEIAKKLYLRFLSAA